MLSKESFEFEGRPDLYEAETVIDHSAVEEIDHIFGESVRSSVEALRALNTEIAPVTMLVSPKEMALPALSRVLFTSDAEEIK